MAQSSSMMLVELIEGENEVQMHLNSTDFEITMDASSFEYEQNRHGLIQFHVQSCSTMLQDQESITRNGLDVKNFEESLREKI